MNSLENITVRRTRTQSDPPTYDDSNIISDTLNGTTNSLPDISYDEDDQIKQFKVKIEKLVLELASAHQEIEELSHENNSLKQANEDLMKKNDVYKRITNSPIKSSKSTPNKNSSIHKKHKQTQTKTMLNTFKIDSNGKETEKSYQNKKINNNSRQINQKSMEKRKICIISSNKNNKVLSTAEDTLRTEFNLCHYLTPDVGVQQLLAGIKQKLTNFTKKDFCIIFIGEKDFKITNNYCEIVLKIREELQDINHTNIVICVPTYNSYATLFNWRVEAFNNLLYLDILTHEHAYLLDSNLNLAYDHSMFNRHTGLLNNYGLQVIFKDILDLIIDINTSDINNSDIQSLGTKVTEIQSEKILMSNDTFFLD